MHELNGKIAVVSGASRGIGEASARALDAAGARVVLSGRTVSDLYRVAGDLANDPVVWKPTCRRHGRELNLPSGFFERSAASISWSTMPVFPCGANPTN